MTAYLCGNCKQAFEVDVDSQDGRFRCPNCQQINAIAVPQIENQRKIESQRKQIKELEERLKKSTATSYPQSPPVRVSFQTVDIDFVPLQEVENIQHASAEFNIATSLSSLFFGLFVQEVIQSGLESPITVLLFLITVIMTGASGYFYWKKIDYQKKLKENKNSRTYYFYKSSEAEDHKHIEEAILQGRV